MRRPDRPTTRLLLLSVGVAAMVATMVSSTIAVGILLGNSQQAVQQRAISYRATQQTKALAELLVQCTTAPQFRKPPIAPIDLDPSDCYARQQAQSADVLGAPPGPLKPYISIAATCGAAHPGDIGATDRCVRAALTDRRGLP